MLGGKQNENKYDDSEFLFCRVCGQDYEADPNDLGTYICPCGRKNKNIDSALARIGEIMACAHKHVQSNGVCQFCDEQVLPAPGEPESAEKDSQEAQDEMGEKHPKK